MNDLTSATKLLFKFLGSNLLENNSFALIGKRTPSELLQEYKKFFIDGAHRSRSSESSRPISNLGESSLQEISLSRNKILS